MLVLQLHLYTCFDMKLNDRIKKKKKKQVDLSLIIFPMQGRGRKKLAAGSWDWEAEKERFLTAIAQLLQLEIFRLWDPPVVEEDFVK